MSSISPATSERPVFESNPDHDAIVSVIDTFFAAMYRQDVESAASVMLDRSLYVGSMVINGTLRTGSFTKEEFLSTLSERPGMLERFWDPEVRIVDRIATASTPFDFYMNGRFSHCGVNLFNFVKTSEGWKIAGVVYTHETQNCAESPLGPPEFQR